MKKAYSLVIMGILLLTAACTTPNENSSSLNQSKDASDISGLQTTDNGSSSANNDNTQGGKAKVLGTVVLNSVQFPATVEITDSKIASDVIGINLDDCENYYIAQQMMSVHLVEVIIVEAKDGKSGDILNNLNDRKKALIEKLAFYPDQVESVENTVVGETNGIVYLIAHKDAEKAKEELLKNI